MKYSEHEKRDVLISILLNVSALCFIPFILLGILVPLAIWIFSKDRYSTADEVGRRLLNFQICWSLLIIYLFSMVFIDQAFHLPIASPGAWLMEAVWLLYIVNILFIVFNAVRCYLGKEVFYPALRIIK